MIRLELEGPGQLKHLSETDLPPLKAGFRRLDVLCCGICRTDGRMWATGHRDLLLPRVMGHEVACADPASGEIFTIWPAEVCGSCRYCAEKMEHLCDNIRIIGFHLDGGFADTIDVPHSSLVPVPADTRPELLCLAEPIACALHSLSSISVGAGDRVLVYGGGLLGMLVALACTEAQAKVTVIERSGEKRDKTAEFSSAKGIDLQAESTGEKFDAAINCCDNPLAFESCLKSLDKGGRLGFFSGLTNHTFTTDLINLIHYRGLTVTGTYGPRRQDMESAVDFCRRHSEALPFLIEMLVSPSDVEKVLAEVAEGRALKYILDFRN